MKRLTHKQVADSLRIENDAIRAECAALDLAHAKEEQLRKNASMAALAALERIEQLEHQRDAANSLLEAAVQGQQQLAADVARLREALWYRWGLSGSALSFDKWLEAQHPLAASAGAREGG